MASINELFANGDVAPLIDDQFPKVESICCDIRQTFDDAHAAPDKVAKERAYRRQHQLTAEAEAIYADELLPVLLPGEWRVTKRDPHNAYAVLPRPDRYHANLHTLLDHAIVYRRAGTRGPINAQCAAVIGLPYDALDKDDGSITGRAIDEASFLARYGIGVWVRANLSAWYPGWTQLVVAAAGLLGRTDAEKFGFQVVPVVERDVFDISHVSGRELIPGCVKRT
jgi:hypothetical protein